MKIDPETEISKIIDGCIHFLKISLKYIDMPFKKI